MPILLFNLRGLQFNRLDVSTAGDSAAKSQYGFGHEFLVRAYSSAGKGRHRNCDMDRTAGSHKKSYRIRI
jgi:hypothetical protein